MTNENARLAAGDMVLVTGGTGFLGAYIIQHLVANGYRVRAIRRHAKLPFFIPATVFEKVEWVDGDILDLISLEDAIDGVDAVVHAAAKVSFVSDNRKEMFQTNIDGTANVVNTAISRGIKRFVHVSSVAALGRVADENVIDENKKWQEDKLNTNYGLSKYRAEMEVWRAIGEGLPAVIVNPSTIIGYGDWNTSSCTIFKSVYDGFPWYTNGINGFVGVEDVANAVLSLLESNITGERFILNADNWSFRQLFNTIADGFNRKHPSREATPLLGGIAWRMEKVKTLFTQKPSLLTKESAKVAQTKTYFDNSKIQKFLPRFAFTALQQSIQNACAQYVKAPVLPELAK